MVVELDYVKERLTETEKIVKRRDFKEFEIYLRKTLLNAIEGLSDWDLKRYSETLLVLLSDVNRILKERES